MKLFNWFTKKKRPEMLDIKSVIYQPDVDETNKRVREKITKIAKDNKARVVIAKKTALIIDAYTAIAIATNAKKRGLSI